MQLVFSCTFSHWCCILCVPLSNYNNSQHLQRAYHMLGPSKHISYTVSLNCVRGKQCASFVFTPILNWGFLLHLALDSVPWFTSLVDHSVFISINARKQELFPLSFCVMNQTNSLLEGILCQYLLKALEHGSPTPAPQSGFHPWPGPHSRRRTAG